MDTTIDQQVVMDEALVPHAQRLRIGRSNFRLLSDIKSKESTLQLVYDVLRICPFFKAFLMDNKKHIVNLELFRDMLHICPRVAGQSFAEPPFEEEILAFICFLGHSAAIRNLIDVNINKLYQPWRDPLVYTTRGTLRAAPPKPKASIRKTRSSSDTSITPSTVAAGPILTASAKGKQTAKASKAKSLFTLSEVAMTEAQQLKLVTKRSLQQTHISQASGSGTDEGTGDDDDDQEVEMDDDKDDEEEGGNDDQEYDEDEYDEETRDEESFDHIPKTPENSDDEGNGEENIDLNIGGEERNVEEEEEDELYKDVNINQGRGIQATLEVEDSHVTLTLINPDGQQQSSSLRMNEAVKVAVQIQSDHLHDEAQRENDEFLKTVDENMQKIIKEQVNEQVKTSYAVAAGLSEMELKKILIKKMEGNKSIQRSDEQRNLYKALVEAYESDKIILDTYRDIVTLKRRHDDDADKDEEPSAGPDRGSKRHREGKEPESASALTKTTTRSAGRSTQRSRSRQASASESALAEEPMQTTFQMEEPSHPEFDTCAQDQPIVQSSQHPEWFSQQQKPPTPDHDWNKTLSAVHRSIQQWISKLAKQTDSRSSFNELMDTPLDFLSFLINRLKVDILTLELLAGPTYELIKGSCKSLVELKYHLEEVFKLQPINWTRLTPKTKAADYEHIKWIEDMVPRTMWIEEPIGYDKHALWGVSYWGRKRQQFYSFAVNQESTRDVYSKRRIIAVTELKIVEWYNYKHLDWITVRRDDDKLYKFKEGDFKRLRIQYTEDMLLLLVQGKLTNLTIEEHFAFNNKDKKNRLMRIDELYKFSDGTLTDVRTDLDDRLKGIRMQYLPQSIWRKSDKDRAAAIIQAIDKRLKTKRIMRSLERITLASDMLIDFQIKFSTSIGETVTHWFTLIMLCALRRSNNKNMLSLMNLIIRSIFTDLQVTPTKPG
uniref:Uncharacterized protein n=1 Tax=Tanacetum cinerariifolium TaxID=118510 RepID=A0A699I3B5_TANCI|nr:hypothetical protein [Tanacetum cinerariifolium]